MKAFRFFVFYSLSIILVACQLGGAKPLANIEPSAVPPSATPLPPTPTSLPPTDSPTPAPTATVTPIPSDTPEPSLPPEPQPITFNTSDGQELKGLFYPAARMNAPVVVLMHWVMSDMSDWYEIAIWLQNRGQKNPFPNPAVMPWWQPDWFPNVPEGRSYNVFIFTYRTCQPFDKGCGSVAVNKWLLDSQAAMQTAATLPGIDSQRIVAMGSSIGADGAPDGCQFLNTQTQGNCLGALSLSPGGYLTVPYPKVVKELSESQPPRPVWCLADEKEISICNGAGDFPSYQKIEIKAGQHGNMLIRPNLEKNTLQLFLDFLLQTTGE